MPVKCEIFPAMNHVSIIVIIIVISKFILNSQIYTEYIVHADCGLIIYSIYMIA